MKARERIAWLEAVAVEDGQGCRAWPWARNDRGYGAVRWRGRTTKATHVVLELAGRPRPTPRDFALHSCDRPACVAPWHLRWGSAAQNAADAAARNRTARLHGEADGMARLSDADVVAIRAAEGRTVRDLGAEYGVHFTVIQKIRAGKTWRHLLPEQEAS